MQVYFNLHKKSWSVRDPRTGRVVNKGQTQCLVVLRNVTFKVSEAGRQRVLREKRKNVHAFACGDEVKFFPNTEFNDPGSVARLLASANVPVSYNPYKAGHFVRTDTGEAVHACTLLVMTTKMVEVLKDGKPTGVLKRIPVVKALL
jgi:hypothetical protein